jgi:c-di-GMP-binding flagellar brake protein YcgR
MSTYVLDTEQQSLVLVRTPAEEVLEARLVHARPDLIDVAFAGPRAPALPITELVSLTLMRLEVTVNARVVHCEAEGVGLRYRFEVDAPGRVALGSLINQRGAVRVSASTSAIDVAIFVKGAERPARGVLDDISETGASVLVATEDERMLFASISVGLEFLLPGDGKPLRLMGTVRNRALVGSAIRYGVQFLPKATPDFEAVQHRIYQFVIKREVERAARSR